METNAKQHVNGVRNVRRWHTWTKLSNLPSTHMKTSVQKQKQRSGETHGGRTGLKTGRRILKRSTFTNGKRFEKAKARPKEMGAGVARTVINGCASVSATESRTTLRRCAQGTCMAKGDSERHRQRTK